MQKSCMHLYFFFFVNLCNFIIFSKSLILISEVMFLGLLKYPDSN